MDVTEIQKILCLKQFSNDFIWVLPWKSQIALGHFKAKQIFLKKIRLQQTPER